MVFIGQGEESVIQAVAADVGVEVDFVAAFDGAGEAEAFVPGDVFPTREEALHFLNPVLVAADNDDLLPGEEGFHLFIGGLGVGRLFILQIVREAAQGDQLLPVPLPLVHLRSEADLSLAALLLQITLLAEFSAKFFDLSVLLCELLP